MCKWYRRPMLGIRVLGVGLILAGCLHCGGREKSAGQGRVFKGVPAPARSFRFHPQRYGIETDNGIRVVVLPDFSTGLVEVGVRYDVGAANDPTGKGGLAHFAEHLLFEVRDGTDDGEAVGPTVGARLADFEVYSNASTTLDSTHFSVIAPKSNLAEIFDVEAIRMAARCQAIPSEIIAREREVVRNEIAQRNDSLASQLYSQLISELYPNSHPYAHTPGGTDAEVSTFTKDDVCSFIQEHYVTENALVLISGAVSRSEVIAATERLEVIPRSKRASVSVPPTVDANARTVEIEADVDGSLVLIAWPVEPHYTSEGYLSNLVGQRVVGLLRESNEKDRFAESVSMELVGGVRAPYALFVIELSSDESRADALKAMDKAVGVARKKWSRGMVLSGFSLMMLEILHRYEALASRSALFADYIQFGNLSLLSGDFETILEMDGKKLAHTAIRLFRREKRIVSP